MGASRSIWSTSCAISTSSSTMSSAKEAGLSISDRVFRAERMESWSSGERRSNSARVSGSRSSIVMYSRCELESSARSGAGGGLGVELVSSASHDGADEKLRYSLNGTRQSGHRGFRLAVVLQLICSIDLLRHRTAPAILKEKPQRGYFEAFHIANSVPS